MELTHKVFAYITHGNRLLVFDHVGFPEEAPQAPAGTRPEHEDPEEAVLRAAWEEAGLKSLICNNSCLERHYPAGLFLSSLTVQ